MVHVAVPGGTSQGLAFSIVSALVDRGHTVTVLSRSTNVPEHLQPISSKITIKAVDYNSQESLVSALTGVHTIVSTLGDPASLLQNHLNLLDAAKSAGVKRFAPSEWSVPDVNDKVALYEPKLHVWRAAEKSGLELAAFSCGLFMNYIASGYNNEALAGLKPVKVGIDSENWKAKIPGDGNAKISYTRIQDVGKFVAAAVELDSWKEVHYQFHGDRKSLNEIVKILEEVEGKKMEVTYVPVSEYEEDKRPAKEDIWGRFAWDCDKMFLEGRGDFGAEPNLNKLVGDKVEGVKNIEEFVDEWFGKK